MTCPWPHRSLTLLLHDIGPLRCVWRTMLVCARMVQALAAALPRLHLPAYCRNLSAARPMAGPGLGPSTSYFTPPPK